MASTLKWYYLVVGAFSLAQFCLVSGSLEIIDSPNELEEVGSGEILESHDESTIGYEWNQTDANHTVDGEDIQVETSGIEGQVEWMESSTPMLVETVEFGNGTEGSAPDFDDSSGESKNVSSCQGNKTCTTEFVWRYDEAKDGLIPFEEFGNDATPIRSPFGLLPPSFNTTQGETTFPPYKPIPTNMLLLNPVLPEIISPKNENVTDTNSTYLPKAMYGYGALLRNTTWGIPYGVAKIPPVQPLSSTTIGTSWTTKKPGNFRSIQRTKNPKRKATTKGKFRGVKKISKPTRKKVQRESGSSSGPTNRSKFRTVVRNLRTGTTKGAFRGIKGRKRSSTTTTEAPNDLATNLQHLGDVLTKMFDYDGGH